MTEMSNVVLRELYKELTEKEPAKYQVKQIERLVEAFIQIPENDIKKALVEFVETLIATDDDILNDAPKHFKS